MANHPRGRGRKRGGVAARRAAHAAAADSPCLSDMDPDGDGEDGAGTEGGEDGENTGHEVTVPGDHGIPPAPQAFLVPIRDLNPPAGVITGIAREKTIVNQGIFYNLNPEEKSAAMERMHFLRHPSMRLSNQHGVLYPFSSVATLYPRAAYFANRESTDIGTFGVRNKIDKLRYVLRRAWSRFQSGRATFQDNDEVTSVVVPFDFVLFTRPKDAEGVSRATLRMHLKRRIFAETPPEFLQIFLDEHGVPTEEGKPIEPHHFSTLPLYVMGSEHPSWETLHDVNKGIFSTPFIDIGQTYHDIVHDIQMPFHENAPGIRDLDVKVSVITNFISDKYRNSTLRETEMPNAHRRYRQSLDAMYNRELIRPEGHLDSIVSFTSENIGRFEDVYRKQKLSFPMAVNINFSTHVQGAISITQFITDARYDKKILDLMSQGANAGWWVDTYAEVLDEEVTALPPLIIGMGGELEPEPEQPEQPEEPENVESFNDRMVQGQERLTIDLISWIEETLSAEELMELTEQDPNYPLGSLSETLDAPEPDAGVAAEADAAFLRELRSQEEIVALLENRKQQALSAFHHARRQRERAEANVAATLHGRREKAARETLTNMIKFERRDRRRYNSASLELSRARALLEELQARPRTEQELRKNTFSSAVKNFSYPRVRNFEDIMKGEKAYSETIGYMIRKHRVDEDGNLILSPIQTFYMIDNADINRINFIDSQVKYGEEYVYRIYACNFVIGTKYTYDDYVSPARVPISNREMTQELTELQFVREDSPANNERLGFTILDTQFGQGSNSPPFRVKLTTSPYIILVKVPFFEKRVIMEDAPPVFPQVEFVPYKGITNIVKINLSANIGRYFLEPIIIEPEDEEKFNRIKIAQDMRGSNLIVFKSDDPPAGFEIFRMEEEPENIMDFAGKKIAFVGTRGSVAADYEDFIVPNKKYYYIFRSVDRAGHISNPTDVYSCQIIKTENGMYLDVSIFDIDAVFKEKTKDLRRILYINPAMIQKAFNVEQEFIMTGEEPLRSAPEGEPELGLFERSIWNKRFKIRIKSKNSGKKVDINIKFKKSVIDHTEGLPPVGAEDENVEADNADAAAAAHAAAEVPPHAEPGGEGAGPPPLPKGKVPRWTPEDERRPPRQRPPPRPPDPPPAPAPRQLPKPRPPK